MDLAGARVVEVHRPVAVLLAQRVRQPPAVGRPADPERRQRAVSHPHRGGLDLLRAAALDVGQPDDPGLVDVRHAARVRRPERRVAKARAEVGELPLPSRAVRRAHRQLVLARPIAPVRHVLPVGRPARVALGHARRARQVQHHAVPRGQREDVAPRLEHGPLARGRDASPVDVARDLLRVGLQAGQIRHDLDPHLVQRVVGQAHAVQLPAGLEDQILRTDRRIRHVEVREVRDLRRLAPVRVHLPDVVALGGPPVREEVQRAPVPHGLRVVGVVVRQVGRRGVVQVERPDLGRGAAPVALPRAGVALLLRVGERHAVRRDGPELAVRHGQLVRQPALDRDGEELAEALPSALAPRREEDPPPVGRPVQDAVRHGMVGQPPRLAAERGHHVDVDVAVVVGAERDLRAVRREAGERLLTLRRAEPLRGAPLLRHHPDIARIHERDPRA